MLKGPFHRQRLRLVPDYNFLFSVICQWKKCPSPGLALIRRFWKQPKTSSELSHLQISVDNVLRVAVVDSRNDLWTRGDRQSWSTGNSIWGLVQCGHQEGGVFVPVEIWLWLQPPSFSHETRGSQTLHLWVCTADRQISQVIKPEAEQPYIISLYAADIHNQFHTHQCGYCCKGVSFKISLVATQNTECAQP